jgi:hypothetical protein
MNKTFGHLFFCLLLLTTGAAVFDELLVATGPGSMLSAFQE